MLAENELPERLRPLVGRQAVELSNDSWDYDVGRLVGVLERVLLEQRAPAGRRAGLGRAAGRRPTLAGFLAGGRHAAVVAALLAATGYFEKPLLDIGAFHSTPPSGESSIARCRAGALRLCDRERPLLRRREPSQLARAPDARAVAVQQHRQEHLGHLQGQQRLQAARRHSTHSRCASRT